jgi:hypothetical protein
MVVITKFEEGNGGRRTGLQAGDLCNKYVAAVEIVCRIFAGMFSS